MQFLYRFHECPELIEFLLRKKTLPFRLKKELSWKGLN